MPKVKHIEKLGAIINIMQKTNRMGNISSKHNKFLIGRFLDSLVIFVPMIYANKKYWNYEVSMVTTGLKQQTSYPICRRTAHLQVFSP